MNLADAKDKNTPFEFLLVSVAAAATKITTLGLCTVKLFRMMYECAVNLSTGVL